MVALLFKVTEALSEPVAAVAQGHVRIDVDTVSPAAPLETVFGAVVEDVGKFRGPTTACLHRF